MKALVTGGTSGIGYGVACQLIEQGWAVTIVGRNKQRGKAIAADTGVEFIQADLSLMSEVDRLAAGLQTPLDALVLCAGIVDMRAEVQFTGEGYERTFATNYLSRYLLSQRLLPQMTDGGSIVMVSGDGNHKNVSTDWATPHAGMPAARKAAVAVDLYAAELAANQPRLRVHTCYPGPVKTNLVRDAAWPIRLYMQLFGSSLEQGSAHLTQLVTQRHEGVHWNKNAPMQFSALPADNGLSAYSQAILEKHMQMVQEG